MSDFDSIQVLAVLESAEARKNFASRIAAADSGLRLIAVAEGFYEALPLLDSYLPDILVADSGRQGDGPKLIRMAKKRWPQLWAILLYDPARRYDAGCGADFLLSLWAETALLRDVFNRITGNITARRRFLHAYVETAGPQEAQDSPAQYIRQYVARNYDRPLSIAALAKRFNYAPSTISRLFKSEFGISPLRFQKQLRVSAAKKLLLKHPGMEIHRVAAAVGYGDSQYFSRIFHKEVGCSPSEWLARKNNI